MSEIDEPQIRPKTENNDDLPDSKKRKVIIYNLKIIGRG